jgi:signal transduction histidine kinase
LKALESAAYDVATSADVFFEVVSAFQGHEAVELVERATRARRPFAVAFVDASMPPGYDGVETTRRLWEIQPELQVVICTAYSETSWEDITSTLGMGHNLLILRKPFDVLEVKQLAFALSEKWLLERATESRMKTLTALVADLDHFTRVASHDLQGPLRAVANLASWLKEDVGDALSEQSGEHLELLMQRVRRMELLLSRLRDYTRADRFDRRTSTVSVADEVQAAFGSFTASSRFELDISGEEPSLVTHRDAMAKVLGIVLHNAMAHHDRERGEIAVRLETEANAVVIEISDDGPGVGARYQERVFGLFVTLRRRDERETAGAGLAIARKILHRVGGTIELRSPATDASGGRGTMVTIRWPRLMSARGSGAPPRGGRHQRTRR